MSWAKEYSSETAFWLALRRQAATRAKSTRVPQQELLRLFVMERFMARMFQTPDAPWIVAGGTNLLIRVPGMRATRDIDINTPSANYGTLDDIRADLELIAAESPDQDPFDFVIDDKVGTFSGGLQGSSWRITATISGQRAAVFGLDLAADDTTPTSAIERRNVTPTLSDIRGLPALPQIPLYPLESQIADKILSVTYRDQHHRTSNRYRDLVDLAIYAGYTDVDADKLRNAVQRRAERRGQNVPTRFEVSPDWAEGYGKIAAVSNLPQGLLGVETAAEVVAAWLDPLLAEEVPGESFWDHQAGVWRSSEHSPSKPGQVWVRPHTRLEGDVPVIEHYRRQRRRSP